MSNRTVLYRAYDMNHELLYIGISSQAFARFDQHTHTSKWMSDCWYVICEHYKTRLEALAAEKQAIQTEFPKFNQVHKKELPDETRNLSPETQS